MADEEKQHSPATVQKHADWHLVSYGAWQISVAPDGAIMLPRHLHHRDVDEFVGCLAVAKDVATTVAAANEQRALKVSPGLPTRNAIIRQGPPPPGTVRMPTKQQRSATIGRAKGRAGRAPVRSDP